MAWNNDPLVRDLADYCNKHKFPLGIFWGITEDSKHAQLVSFGKTKGLCDKAKTIGNEVVDAIFAEDNENSKGA